MHCLASWLCPLPDQRLSCPSSTVTHPCELRSSLHPRLQHPPVTSTLPALAKSVSEELRAAVGRSGDGASGTAVRVRRFEDGARAEQATGLRRRCGCQRRALAGSGGVGRGAGAGNGAKLTEQSQRGAGVGGSWRRRRAPANSRAVGRGAGLTAEPSWPAAEGLGAV
ncbi:hypothetical protein GUJ93_ZPchr0013g37666 [Zizania palustris]|uniref:Uncharacterized protein n=1 Tax=Zizania palustris TaxID=103762 RepID=A0A8J6BUZ9_ZIZPA|nr:hypothetical protein GUJ93_ZPchr0013g37666 [Zizania palustris]